MNNVYRIASYLKNEWIGVCSRVKGKFSVSGFDRWVLLAFAMYVVNSRKCGEKKLTS